MKAYGPKPHCIFWATALCLLLAAFACETPQDAEEDDDSEQIDDSEESEKEDRESYLPGEEDFVRIDAGTFMMGAPDDDEDAFDGERPQHEVTLTRNFWLQTKPVTQANMAALDSLVDSEFEECANCPADNITWYDAVAYVNRLSDAHDLPRCYDREGTVIDGETVYDCSGYRLPTEAEWEFAYRAGTTTPYFWGQTSEPALAEQYAWFIWNSGDHTQPVGRLKPNEWGLYDMAGNVEEWTHDAPRPYNEDAATDPGGDAAQENDNRMQRGASALRARQYLRGSNRQVTPAGIANHHEFPSGFRIARTADD